MASVFLSYDRDDARKARPVALALEEAGHSVWWDLHVRGGAQFSKAIEKALKAADAVVVLWSKQSVESPWVRDEAAAGRDSARLIPVALDQMEPPLGFRQFQTIDLSRWNGRGRIPHLEELLRAIEELGDMDTRFAAPQPVARGELNERLRHLLPAGAAALAVVIVAAALLLWRPWQTQQSAPIVAVVAAQQSPEANTLARDLLVQLGSLQASNTDALQLVGLQSTERPDFIFEVSGSKTGRNVGANLALLSGRNRALLWSEPFEQPADSEADLRQQLAYSAAQVLLCASEATMTGGDRLSAKTVRLYLNGCAEIAESFEAKPASVAAVFARVVQDAPSFREGWAKLLLAESRLIASSPFSEGERASLRRHLAEATAIHPDLPEIRLAKIELLPANAFSKRLILADQARELGPNNASVRALRSLQLMRVGRLNEAVDDIARALELAPLSPSIRNAYISTLAYAGKMDMAKAALDEAERLWPGSSSVRNAKYRYHYRFGDATTALAMLQSGEQSTEFHEEHTIILEAKTDPTPEKIDRAVQAAQPHFAALSQLLGELGRDEQLYRMLDRSSGPIEIGSGVMFRPALTTFRQDPRFMQVADRLGLVDYWRTSGIWPDFCDEPDLPYDCEAEAAKIAE